MRPACHTRNAAPSGSANTASRPAGPTSIGATSVLPPAPSTFATTASALSTLMYVFHAGFAAPGPEPIPATSSPSTSALTNRVEAPPGVTSSNDQPNTPP